MNPTLRERWILANTLGFALGGAVGGQVSRLLEQPYVGIRSPGWGALVLARDAGGASSVLGAAAQETQR